jgi:Flp pilus assembly protein TadD
LINVIKRWFSNQPESFLSGLVLLCLSALIIGSFWQVTNSEFVNFDDTDYVTENFNVQQGVSFGSVKWALTTNHAGNWHPLTWVSHMVDCSLYGLKAPGHHLTNLILHLASTLILFLFLKEMTGSFWRSAFVAALFGLHPMHVESVAWISERKDVLSGFFAMLTLWLYGRYARAQAEISLGERPASDREWVSYFLALFFFGCGLMSKAMLVTLPFVLLLLDFWPLRRFPLTRPLGKLALEKVPFFILTIAAALVTFLIQKNAGAMSQDPLSYRIWNAFLGYVGYLQKLLWPMGLSVYYPLPETSETARGICSLLLVIVFSAVTVWRAKKQPYFFVGWFIFLGMLVPVIGLVQVGSQAMADRYTYLPSIGFFILITWAVCDLIRRRFILAMAGFALIAVCTGMTVRQVSYWKDSVSLFTRASDTTRKTDLTQLHLGAAFAFCGRGAEAIPCFEEAAKLNPVNDVVRLNWGIALIAMGKDEQALEQLEISLKLKPGVSSAYDNCGIALTHLKRYPEAEAQYRKALELNSEQPAVLSRLAFSLMEQKKFLEAEPIFLHALRLNPNLHEAHVYLGFVYMNLGRFDEAIEHCRAALRLQPDDVGTQKNLQVVLARKQAGNAPAKH